MTNFNRALGALLAGACAVLSVSLGAQAAGKGTPAPAAASASPAPLPTATPEPPDKAIPRLEAAVKANPNDRASLQQLAGYYLAVGRAPSALPLTQKLISLGEKTAQVYYLDGSANQQLGRIKEATYDFEQASNQEPTNAQILLTLTDLYLRTNRPADAEKVAKRATTFNPNDKQAFVNYGLVFAAQKKFDDARAQFETAAKLDPKDPSPIVLEARTYVNQSAFPLALQLYDRALAIDPKYGDALIGKARLLAVQHKIPEAMAAYAAIDPILTSDDAHAALLIEESQVYAQEKMTSDQERVLKQALSSYPSVASVHVAYGDYLAQVKHDLGGAENEWKTALGPKRDSPEAAVRLGGLYQSQNKLGQAQDMFKLLTTLTPGDPAAFLQLGQVQLASKQLTAARQSFVQAFGMSHAPQALAYVGVTDVAMKSYGECAKVFDALDRGAQPFLKQTPQLYFAMGQCYQGNRQNDKARVAYQRLLPYAKSGEGQTKVKALIASVSGSSKPAPKATATPKRK